LKISHPSPKTILAGEVCRDAAKAASVPRRSQRRARQQKAAGQERVWGMVTGKEKAVRLLQQSDGAPRFGKHGLQLCSV